MVLAASILVNFGSSIAWLGTICNLGVMVIGITGLYKLSKAFGHGVGFTLGLMFLNPIFMMILGFGSDQYQGK